MAETSVVQKSMNMGNWVKFDTFSPLAIRDSKRKHLTKIQFKLKIKKVNLLFSWSLSVPAEALLKKWKKSEKIFTSLSSAAIHQEKFLQTNPKEIVVQGNFKLIWVEILQVSIGK